MKLDRPVQMQAVIYVVDSSDTERIAIAKEEFHAILEEDELRDALVLVYANKQARRLVFSLIFNVFGLQYVPPRYLPPRYPSLSLLARSAILEEDELRDAMVLVCAKST